jgi:hypothetical protein
VLSPVNVYYDTFISLCFAKVFSESLFNSKPMKGVGKTVFGSPPANLPVEVEKLLWARGE